jgi:phosphoribosylformylglycinamidine cyclo-ligase
MSNEELSYKNAGVDTHKGQEFIKKIKEKVHSTHNPRVLGGLGGFAAAYDVSFLKNYKEPVLLSGTDGVGTKLELARLLGIHDTIGIDLVAMCVNDLLVNGARPLYFLDYISCGKLDIQKMDSIVSGIVKGCLQCGASLVGGETAEHPGIMKEDEYDLAGFAVGVVEKSEIIDGKGILPGDVILGLESSGPHSNGFSLLRKMYLDGGKLPQKKEDLDFIQNVLFRPTRIYVESILKLLQKEEVKGMVHITGGGFYENIPRVLNGSDHAYLDVRQIPETYCFSKISRDHSLSKQELFSTFNMGIGYLLIVEKGRADSCMQILNSLGESAVVLGEIRKGEKGITLNF